MKRQIKFRAWDIENKEMLYFVFSALSRPSSGWGEDFWKGKKGKQNGRLDFDNCEECVTGYNHDDFNSEYTCELMQLTGLKDKNGKEIYEGDIITTYDPYTKSQHTDQVIWDDNNCRYAIKNTYVDFDFLIVDEIEIVGNIYENPKLL